MWERAQRSNLYYYRSRFFDHWPILSVTKLIDVDGYVTNERFTIWTVAEHVGAWPRRAGRPAPAPAQPMRQSHAANESYRILCTSNAKCGKESELLSLHTEASLVPSSRSRDLGIDMWKRDHVCLKEKVGHVTFLGTINTGIERKRQRIASQWFREDWNSMLLF